MCVLQLAGKWLPLLSSLCAALLKKLLVQRTGHVDVDHHQRGLCCCSGFAGAQGATLRFGKSHWDMCLEADSFLSSLACAGVSCWRGLTVAGGTVWSWPA